MQYILDSGHPLFNSFCPLVTGSVVHKPVPAMALLPSLSPSPPDTPRPDVVYRRHAQQAQRHAGMFDSPIKPSQARYKWVPVGVLGYNANTKLYHVRRVVPVAPEMKRSILTGVASELSTAKEEKKADHRDYHVPRIQLMFRAEDPEVFAKRVASAERLRRLTEALLRYNFYIDCMPTDHLPPLEHTQLNKMVHWAQDTPGLQQANRSALLVQLVQLLCAMFLLKTTTATWSMYMYMVLLRLSLLLLFTCCVPQHLHTSCFLGLLGACRTCVHN